MFTFEASIREILEQAIRNEMTSLVYLEQIAARVQPAEHQRTMRELISRKVEHLSHFERRFHEMFREPSPDFARPDLGGAHAMGPINLQRALQLANERERDLESNWRFLAEQVTAPDQRDMLLELAETQWRFREEVHRMQSRTGLLDDILDF